MRIIIDADAAPIAVKEMIYRASARLGIEVVLVANTGIRHPESTLISMIIVPSGPDEADDRIANIVAENDLVITSDIPLAARAVEKGGFVITPRGELLTKDNVGERLTIRDMMDQLRSGGVETGGPPPFANKDKAAFARQFELYLTRRNVR